MQGVGREGGHPNAEAGGGSSNEEENFASTLDMEAIKVSGYFISFYALVYSTMVFKRYSPRKSSWHACRRANHKIRQRWGRMMAELRKIPWKSRLVKNKMP